MKSIRVKLNEEKFGRAIASIVGLVLVAISSLAITNVVYAGSAGNEGQSSSSYQESGSAGPGGGSTPTCNGNNVLHYCYTWSGNGGFWLRVDDLGNGLPNGGNDFTVLDLYRKWGVFDEQSYGGLVEGGTSTSRTNSIRIKDCQRNGNAVYIYFTRRYSYPDTTRDPSTIVYGGLVGPVDKNKVPMDRRDNEAMAKWNGTPIGSNPTLGFALPQFIQNMYVTNSSAEAAFKRYESVYAQAGKYWETSNIGWFCADQTETITTTETTSSSLNCTEKTTMNKWAGETKSRIAVENMTLDGVHSSDDDWSLSPSSMRYATDDDGNVLYPSDSGWTDSGGIVYTLAKPGDTIHFLHEMCIGDRYVRQATENNNTAVTSEVGDTSRSYVPGFGAHYVEFGANDFEGDDGRPNTNLSFLTNFSNPVTSTPVGSPANYKDNNNQFYSRSVIYNKTIPAPTPTGNNDSAIKKLFDSVGGTGNDIVASSEGDGSSYGISILSPGRNSNDFNCSSMYEGFVTGGYQITDLNNGMSCPSTERTNVKTVVGKYFSQYHKFSNAKAYEKYRYTVSNNCGCSDSTSNPPTYTNSTNNSLSDAVSQGHNGNLTDITKRTCQHSPTSKNCAYTYTSYYPYFPSTIVHVGAGATGLQHSAKCKSGFWGIETNYYHNPTLGHLYGQYKCSGGNWKEDIRDGNGKDGYWTKYELGSAQWATKYKYNTAVSSGTRMAKVADVFVPYNFETSVSASIDSNDVLYQGSTVNASFAWNINPRANEYTTNNTTDKYATSTPPNSEVRIVEFFIPPSNTTINISGTKKSTTDPCGYYSGASGCNVLNKVQGNLNIYGLNGSYDIRSASTVIPDNNEYIGYKYCVAAGIYPSDSHDYKNTLKGQYLYDRDDPDKEYGSAMDAGSYWNISNASCRTIAKKPSFQVWNGSVYTDGLIDTSITKKLVGYNPTSSETFQQKVFGSWSDYMVVAGKTVKGFGSGASLGFNDNAHFFNLSGSGIASSSYTSGSSPLTISNNNKSSLGNSGISASSTISMVIEKMIARYRDKAVSYASSLGITNQNSLVTTSSGLQFVYKTSDLKISDIVLDSGTSGLAGNTVTISTNGTLAKRLASSATASSGAPINNTLVIYTTGTLTIDKNICYIGDSESVSTCSNVNADATKLKTYQNAKTDTPAVLPQIIIFANQIDVKQDVTRIDAWLFANEEVNTCSDFTLNSTDGTSTFTSTGLIHYDATYSKCYKTLVVNGPVFAKNIQLNRTAGAHHGYGTNNASNVIDRSVGDVGNSADANKGSEAPAEIFNLRSDVFIWSRNQAGGSSEAIVTYIRELAPRY